MACDFNFFFFYCLFWIILDYIGLFWIGGGCGAEDQSGHSRFANIWSESAHGGDQTGRTEPTWPPLSITQVHNHLSDYCSVICLWLEMIAFMGSLGESMNRFEPVPFSLFDWCQSGDYDAINGNSVSAMSRLFWRVTKLSFASTSALASSCASIQSKLGWLNQIWFGCVTFALCQLVP